MEPLTRRLHLIAYTNQKIMKNIKILTGLVLVLFLMTCKDPNTRDNQNATDAVAPVGNNVGEPQDGAIDNNRTRENINAADSLNNAAQNNSTDGSANNGSVNAADNNRMNKMFADLNFTPEQIETFNTKYRQDLEERRKNNASSDIGSEDHLKMEDKHMKSFLSAAQYEQYKEWIKNNPIKNQR